ncbi:hypothetical protein O6H91_08G116900 [Diphasiastrum complanatum]|uniref:Uncharacterized protein n=4 Tax=Diphasiastrum complanatum TaxID=34168 RepID=A0ACC2D1U9_DIPCM|nr:hypothetical protein O6H91_08G116900 [Diphasiastrum complanatum]
MIMWSMAGLQIGSYLSCPVGRTHRLFSPRYAPEVASFSQGSDARACTKLQICAVASLGESNNGCFDRRQVLTGVGTMLASTCLDNGRALAEKAPKGYAAVVDNNDGYAFFYPFGWQEIAIKGQDIAYKDVIEPLESVSINIVKTDKTDLHELGSPERIAKTLVEKVFTTPSQKSQLIDAKEKDANGKTYYTFEFLAKAPNFTRHALGTVAISDGKFYTLLTGANQRRWGKMEDKLRAVVDSFILLK